MSESNVSFQRTSATASLALALLSAGIDAAARRNLRMSIAIIDDSGLVKAFVRMDGASFTSASVAQDKGFTAASGRATHLWHEALGADEILGAGAARSIPRLATLPGGFPIEVDGVLLGGFGVSGGHYSDDVAVALEALATVGARHDW